MASLTKQLSTMDRSLIFFAWAFLASHPLLTTSTSFKISSLSWNSMFQTTFALNSCFCLILVSIPSYYRVIEISLTITMFAPIANVFMCFFVLFCFSTSFSVVNAIFFNYYLYLLFIVRKCLLCFCFEGFSCNFRGERYRKWEMRAWWLSDSSSCTSRLYSHMLSYDTG